MRAMSHGSRDGLIGLAIAARDPTSVAADGRRGLVERHSRGATAYGCDAGDAVRLRRCATARRDQDAALLLLDLVRLQRRVGAGVNAPSVPARSGRSLSSLVVDERIDRLRRRDELRDLGLRFLRAPLDVRHRRRRHARAVPDQRARRLEIELAALARDPQQRALLGERRLERARDLVADPPR